MTRHLATVLLFLSGAPLAASFSVMINGMPGPMAVAAAEASLRKGLTLAPFGLTGPDVPPQDYTVTDPDTQRSQVVRLCPSSDPELVAGELAKVFKRTGDVIAIDYTHPSAVNANGKWYVKNRIPFVMGTTGGDRAGLMKTVEDGKHYAVIAPNMGKQIVAMQYALESLALKFPSSFGGYNLEVKESHQKTKADTSGTAIAVINSIKGLVGAEKEEEFDIEKDIQMLRSDRESLDFGVPKEALKGHAFHTYTLTSPDGSVEFELKHNVCGRRVYAEGTADAVKFLARECEKNGEAGGKNYDMVDVLQAGALA